MYQMVLGCFTIFGAYQSMDFLVFSDTWNPILSPATLVIGTVEGVAVFVTYILLNNLHKGVKIYNGLFNLNEDKGQPRSHVFKFPLSHFDLKQKTVFKFWNFWNTYVFLTGLSYIVPHEEHLSSALKFIYQKVGKTIKKNEETTR